MVGNTATIEDARSTMLSRIYSVVVSNNSPAMCRQIMRPLIIELIVGHASGLQHPSHIIYIYIYYFQQSYR